jgi:hypothetical protein
MGESTSFTLRLGEEQHAELQAIRIITGEPTERIRQTEAAAETLARWLAAQDQ